MPTKKTPPAPARVNVENWMQSTPIKEYLDFWSKYVQFSGTANRPQFWWTFLLDIVIRIVFIVGLVVYGLVTIVPWLALINRRLADSGSNKTLFWSIFGGGMVLGLAMYLIPLIVYSHSVAMYNWAVVYANLMLNSPIAKTMWMIAGLIWMATVIYWLVMMLLPTKKK